jgi:hypothetical protein
MLVMMRLRCLLGLLVLLASACDKPVCLTCPGPVTPPPPPPPLSYETRILSLVGPLAYGDVQLGKSATATLTIFNSGNTELAISSVSYPADFSGDFATGSLAPGASRAVTVTFAPTTASPYSGTVTVNGNQTQGTNTIAATGVGVAVAVPPKPDPPVPPVAPPPIDPLPPPVSQTRIIGLGGSLAFGGVQLGKVGTATLLISNTGNSPLAITSISYPSAFSGDLTSGTIAAGGSETVKVTFAPNAAVGYGGTITVHGNHTAGVNTIAASGTGLPAPVNTAPVVGGPLNTAAPPGTYFEWLMTATDADGDEVTWSPASTHTCSFLRIISQDRGSQSRATAGGAAPPTFSGTCLIRFQACDRFGACGLWGGSYTWNTPPAVSGPLTTAAPPGTYFEWPMFATDTAGDQITWSPATDHTCSFLRIITQDASNPSRAVAGGAAPATFSGTCLIRFKACDQLGACGIWGGSYTWNPGPLEEGESHARETLYENGDEPVRPRAGSEPEDRAARGQSAAATRRSGGHPVQLDGFSEVVAARRLRS